MAPTNPGFWAMQTANFIVRMFRRFGFQYPAGNFTQTWASAYIRRRRSRKAKALRIQRKG